MESRILLRQLLRSPSTCTAFTRAPIRPQHRTLALLSHTSPVSSRFISTNSLPRIIQPSFWSQLIPTFLRRNVDTPRPKRKGMNPATPYIVLGLLVGSQAIQLIWLKRDVDHFSRKADARIGLLREVVERVQRGENVDVEKVLGTGDAVQEQEWEDVLKEIEEEELLFQSKRRRKALRDAAREQQAKKQAQEGPKLESDSQKKPTQGAEAQIKVESYGGSKFY